MVNSCKFSSDVPGLDWLGNWRSLLLNSSLGSICWRREKLLCIVLQPPCSCTHTKFKAWPSSKTAIININKITCLHCCHMGNAIRKKKKLYLLWVQGKPGLQREREREYNLYAKLLSKWFFSNLVFSCCLSFPNSGVTGTDHHAQPLTRCFCWCLVPQVSLEVSRSSCSQCWLASPPPPWNVSS